jgi:hypothetical protein
MRKSTEYRDGNGQVAWTRLSAKYAPKTAPSMIKLEKQFRESRLKKGKDPDVWITNLEELRDRIQEMGSSMTDDQFLVHILNNLSKEYKLQVLLLEKRIGSTTDPLTVEELKGDLNLEFERLHISEDDDNSAEGERALATVQFKGRCSGCGKYGHKNADCRNRTSNPNGSMGGYKGGANTFVKKSSGFKGNCNFCDKYGHKEADCFLKKKGQGGREQANNAVNRKKDNDKNNDVVLLTLEEEDFEDYEVILCTTEEDVKAPSSELVENYSGERADMEARTLRGETCCVSLVNIEARKLRASTAFGTQVVPPALSVPTARPALLVQMEPSCINLLRRVAQLKLMKPADAISWSDDIRFKLEYIGISKISQLRKEIIGINNKLRTVSRSQLHTRTLILIAHEAEKEVENQQHKMLNKIARLQQELLVSRSREKIDDSGLYLIAEEAEKASALSNNEMWSEIT